MDIEGYEFQVMPHVLKSRVLPKQISWEMHLEYLPVLTSSIQSPVDLVTRVFDLMMDVDKAGYRLAFKVYFASHRACFPICLFLNYF